MNKIIMFNNGVTNNIYKKNILNEITNNKVKKIVNVYQIEYENGRQCGGLGDFLRGCITLSLLCHKFGLDFGIDFNNHIIGNFINSNNNEKNQSIPYNNIKLVGMNGIFGQDLEEIVQLINKTNEEICYLCTTINFENNLSMAMCKLTNKNIIKCLLPNAQIIENINIIYSDYKIKSNEYGIIHVRGGDSFLLNNQLDSNYTNLFINFIFNKIKKKIYFKKYILISDNSYLKNSIKHLNNLIVVNDISPVHLALGNMNDLNVMWTLIDFFLIAGSNEVISFSRYMHGSGFSKWGSFIFNKPYIQYIYNEINSNFNSIV